MVSDRILVLGLSGPALHANADGYGYTYICRKISRIKKLKINVKNSSLYITLKFVNG